MVFYGRIFFIMCNISKSVSCLLITQPQLLIQYALDTIDARKRFLRLISHHIARLSKNIEVGNCV